MENTLCVFLNSYFSLPPARNMRVLFLDLHHENLVGGGFLEVAQRLSTTLIFNLQLSVFSNSLKLLFNCPYQFITSATSTLCKSTSAVILCLL